MVKIAFYVLAALLHVGRRTWVSLAYEDIKALASKLASQIGFEVYISSIVTSSNYRPEPTPDIEGVVIIVLTGGTDRMIYNIVSSMKRPTIIYTHPRENSLASVREAIAALRYSGFEANVAYGALEELEPKLKGWLSVLRAHGSLKGSRIGLVGEPEPWLLNLRDPEVLKDKFGVEVVRLSWDDMFERALRADKDLVLEKTVELKKLFPIIEVPDSDLEKALRIYYGLRSLVLDYKLEAVAVEARDMLVEDLRDYGPYLAVALLSSEGVPAEYEVDVEAILTKLLVYKLANRSSFMANLTRVDAEKNTITLSHCTVPIDMIDTSESRLTTYFETGRTVAIRGRMRRGEKVTILRLGGPKLEIMLAARGVIVNGDIGDPNLCRTQIEVKVEGNPIELVEKSIGNHMIVAYGDLLEELRLLASMARITLTLIGSK
jgi:L-fucose isomerase-like protein